MSLDTTETTVADARHAYKTTAEPASLSGDVLRAYLHLANLQFTPRMIAALLEHFANDPTALFAAKDSEFDEISGFLARHLVRLRDPDAEVTDRQWRWMEKTGTKLVLSHRSDYPAQLLEIADPPPILFVRGTLLPSDQTSVGIVGSRHATPYGRGVSERLARELAGHGVTIVSGGAVGIDTAAHRGALDGGGRTLAVLGCGLDVDYPRDNRLLFEKVAESGALISEYPLGAQPESWRFPQRNRLISGLSLGTLVVEAPRQSGALITARFAIEQGRTVLTVPANIDRLSSVGSNDLLKEGCVPVTETADILHALNLVAVPAKPEHQTAFDLDGNTKEPEPHRIRTAAEKRQPSPAIYNDLSENQRKIVACLSSTPRHVDAIAQEVGLSAGQTGVEMTMLELAGLVRRLPGNTYLCVV